MAKPDGDAEAESCECCRECGATAEEARVRVPDHDAGDDR
jgi:hypothetical protein